MRVGLVGAGRIGAVHARTLLETSAVEDLLIVDADTTRSEKLAADLGVRATDDVASLFTGAVDALVITAATSAHAALITRAVEAKLPVFCEKPVAQTVEETLAVQQAVARTGAQVHVGFQRRFDVGFTTARAAVQTGELGWIHTIRAGTCDRTPPPDEYIPTSGGLFRDCLVHDVDAVRWVTGAEVRAVYAAGSNNGSPAFAAAGDVDAAAALLTLDSGAFALLSGTRYNAAGYDVRLELLGSQASVSVGLDDRLPLRSTEPGVTFPPGAPWQDFMSRFASAYTAEIIAFLTVAAGDAPSPCTVSDALQAALVTEACEVSRRENRPVEIAAVAAEFGVETLVGQ